MSAPTASPTLPGLEPGGAASTGAGQQRADAAARRDAVRDRQKAALDAAARSWLREARRTLDALAAAGEPFTAEHLRARCGSPLGPSPNAIGAVFAVASREGRIVAVGWRAASRPEAAGRTLRVWIGSEHG